MILDSKKEILNYCILICVCFYLFGHFSGGLNAVKNLGIYGGFFLCAFALFKFRAQMFDNFKQNVSVNKNLIALILVFYFVIFATSIAPYSDEYNSLKAAFKELKKGIILFVILLFWYKNEYKNGFFIL